MVDILHRIGVEGSTPEKVYDALTTLDGLSGWWAENTLWEACWCGVSGRGRLSGRGRAAWFQVARIDAVREGDLGGAKHVVETSFGPPPCPVPVPPLRYGHD